MWPFNFGLSCCYVELATSITSQYDISRFGAEVIRSTPREADVMIIAGTVFLKMAPVIKRLYEQMMEPRWVISMGSCANSGGMYDVYSVVQGVDKFLPVDVYIPGCPPSPVAFMEGLLLLRDKVGKEKRPLSWVVGPQGVTEPAPLSNRDFKLAERRNMTFLNPPDEVSQIGRFTIDGRFGFPIVNRQSSIVNRKSYEADYRRSAGTIWRREILPQTTRDRIPTAWIPPSRAIEILRHLKTTEQPYRMLYDLTAIDERSRHNRQEQPNSDFSVVYHLLSFDRNEDLRLKVALAGEHPFLPSATALWASANWYEREVWDMFGIRFDGHPHLTQDPHAPETWNGHPLRKEHPARATEIGPIPPCRGRAGGLRGKGASVQAGGMGPQNSPPEIPT